MIRAPSGASPPVPRRRPSAAATQQHAAARTTSASGEDADPWCGRSRAGRAIGASLSSRPVPTFGPAPIESRERSTAVPPRSSPAGSPAVLAAAECSATALVTIAPAGLAPVSGLGAGGRPTAVLVLTPREPSARPPARVAPETAGASPELLEGRAAPRETAVRARTGRAVVGRAAEAAGGTAVVAAPDGGGPAFADGGAASAEGGAVTACTSTGAVVAGGGNCASAAGCGSGATVGTGTSCGRAGRSPSGSR